MWLHNPKTGVTTVVVHPDAIARCLGEGWVEVADPRTVATEAAATEVADAEVGVAPSVALPPVIAEEVERERVAAVHANNDAARAAFADMGMGPKPKGRR